MKKALLIMAVAIALLIAAGACGKAKEGELPALKVGSQWVYRMVSQGIEYRVSIEVTGAETADGQGFWVTQWTLEPPLQGLVSNVTVRIDKATYFPVKTQMTGTAMGTPFSAVRTFSYRFPVSAYWPLEVGKEVKVVESSTTASSAGGKIGTEIKTKTSLYKVENIEELTVPAGTFQSFKVVEYDDAGKKLYTSWYSDRVKDNVKHIDHETGEVTELMSYSLR